MNVGIYVRVSTEEQKDLDILLKPKKKLLNKKDKMENNLVLNYNDDVYIIIGIKIV